MKAANKCCVILVLKAVLEWKLNVENMNKMRCVVYNKYICLLIFV